MTVSEYLAEIDAVNRGGVYQPEWESLCTHPAADCPENPAKAAALADDGSYCKSSENRNRVKMFRLPMSNQLGNKNIRKLKITSENTSAGSRNLSIITPARSHASPKI